MPTLTIDISEEPMRRLKERADKAGIAPEDFLRESVEQWLAKPQDDFAQAAAYVLKKNAELYRRLAG